MAKPDNWIEMDLEEQYRCAYKFLYDGNQFNIRARYIIGQALAYAMAELNKVPEHRKEESNIEDMEMLSLLFEPFVTLVEEQIRSKSNG